MNVVAAILWKDLTTEWRSRDRIVAMLLFSLLVVVVFHFALPDRAGGTPPEGLPGLLWVAFVFAAILGLNRAFALELENEALSGLALVPTDRGYVFLGKAIANFLLLVGVQGATAAAFAIAFDAPLGAVAPELAGIVVLGSLGLSSIGTVFAAISVRTRYREVMLPLLLLPLLIPVLLPAVRATTELLESGNIPVEAVQLLLVTDAVFLIVSFIGFEYVLEE
ncbi:MAG: heme exporter protein CcmB [Myxococcota bacterium]